MVAAQRYEHTQQEVNTFGGSTTQRGKVMVHKGGGQLVSGRPGVHPAADAHSQSHSKQVAKVAHVTGYR